MKTIADADKETSYPKLLEAERDRSAVSFFCDVLRQDNLSIRRRVQAERSQMQEQLAGLAEQRAHIVSLQISDLMGPRTRRLWHRLNA